MPVLFLVVSIVIILCKYKAEHIIRHFYGLEVQFFSANCYILPLLNKTG